MRTVFLQLLDLARMAGYVILAVLVLRLLFQKAPKKYRLLLWALAAIRLVFPFSIQSPVSLLPAQSMSSGFTAGPVFSSGGAQTLPLPDITGSTPPAAPALDLVAVLAIIWLIGCIVLMVYGLQSYIRLRRKVAFAVPLQKGVYVCDGIRTPFVYGLFRPKIYLPAGLEETDIPYVLAHERQHIRHGDHVFKLLAFLLLCVYWFQPLVWLAFFLFGRDLEFACDERVLAQLGAQGKKAYSMALLRCASGRRHLLVYPLAFGETSVKARIKGILNYKKPPFWIAAVTLLAVAVAAICLLTVPKASNTGDQNSGGAVQSVGSDFAGAGFKNARFYTEAGEQKLSVQWYRDTAEEMMFGEPFELYRYQGKTLQKLPELEGTAFLSIGYTIRAQGGTQELVYNLSAYYGKLPNGIYRLTASYTVAGKNYTTWADFAVGIPAYSAAAVTYVDPLSSYMPVLSDFAYIIAGEDALYSAEKPAAGTPQEGQLYVPNPKYVRQTFSSEILAGTYKGSEDARKSLVKRFAAYNGAEWIEIQGADGKPTGQYFLRTESDLYFISRPESPSCFILQLQQI